MKRFPVEERWSEKIAANGWSAVPTVFLRTYAALGIKPMEAIVIVHLMSFKWDRRDPFPSASMLARCLGLSNGQVRAHLRNLEAKGFIKRIARIGRSNQFDMRPLIERLEQVLAQQDSGVEAAQDVEMEIDGQSLDVDDVF